MRRRGYATTVEELEPGLAAVAAPVWEPRGAVVAALSVSGPTIRLTAARLEELARLVIDDAAAITARLDTALPETNDAKRGAA